MLVEPIDVARRDRDRALIEAHCAGDPSVFPVIVREHYNALLAQAHRRLGSPGEAEDATQETFERAYRGLCRVDGEYRIGAWLHRILANVCIDHAARREVQRALPERIGARHTTSPDVSEHASDPVVFRAVQAALDALPATQRQTFWLYEMDGLSYPEVAEQLGISEDNARARVHRAKATLRRRLGRVRDAVAAIIALPFGVRTLSRDGGKLSASLPGDGAPGSALSSSAELAQTAGVSAPGVHSGVAQVAYAVSSGPVANLAVSSASGGPRAFVVVAASVATAVGGMFAAPVVTGSSGSSGASASESVVATPAGENAPGEGAFASVSASVVTSAVETTAPTTPAMSATPAPADAPEGSWIAAGADATSDVVWDSPETTPPGSAAPGAAPVPDPCPWLSAYPGLRASLPGSAPVIGVLDPAEGATESGASLALSSTTTLRIADVPGGPMTTEVPVSLRAQVCLDRGRSAIVADIEGPDGLRAQLRGALVMQLNNNLFLFRGSVIGPSGVPGLHLPWGLPDRFVAQLGLSLTGRNASLDVAFLGAPGTTLPQPALPADPEPSDPATTDPSPTTTTLPTTATTLPTTTTTTPTPPPSTAPDGSSGTGSPP